MANPETEPAALGLSRLEHDQLLRVAHAERRNHRLRDLRRSKRIAPGGEAANDLEVQPCAIHGVSPVSARLYTRWLEQFSEKLRVSSLVDGEVLFFAIAAEEGR